MLERFEVVGAYTQAASAMEDDIPILCESGAPRVGV